MSNRSSSKRTRSPAVVVDPKIPQLDGACFGKPDRAEPVGPEAAKGGKGAKDAKAEPGPPIMPQFLQMTDIGKMHSLCMTAESVNFECKETHDKYAELVRLENERLAASKDAPPDGEWARLDPDPVLDRYSNIHPWANNRIHLKVPDGFNDYINASPVTLVSTSEKQSTIKTGIQDKYICMQGPKKQTVDHVWHMVWHELATPYNSSPAVIVMLSPTHGPSPDDPSKTIEKCYTYFPKDENSEPIVINETNELGEDFKATIRFISREPGIEGTKIEIRQFAMTVEGEDEEKPIWHYLYPNWPDFGALEEQNVASILSLMEKSREHNGKGENARVIHCSAGVGRTGTFVALEFLLGELTGGAWEGWEQSAKAGTDPVYDTVNQLRTQRKTMVQAYEQYAFLYEVLRKIWEEKYGTECVGGEHKHPAGESPAKKRNVCDNID
jgi:protein-tyrosine phosphatase